MRQRREPVTIVLIVINLVVFAITYLSGLNQAISELGLARYTFLHGYFWTPLTAIFVHVSVMHVAMNMVSLWFMGRLMEPALGRNRFLLVYFGTALCGDALCLLLASPYSISVGASGAIFGLIGAAIMVFRKNRSVFMQLMFWAGLNLVFTFWGSGIAWQAHVGGLLGGLLIGWQLTRTHAVGGYYY